MLRMPLAVLVSLAIHLFAVWFFNSRDLRTPEKIEIQIEMREVRTRPPAGGSLGKGRKGGTKHGLRKFIPHHDGYNRESVSNLQNEGNLGLEEEDWGSHGSRFEEIVNYNRYLPIFNDIQGMLNYPGPLCLRKIDGTINSRLMFNNESRCDWKRSHVAGSNPYLRVYSLAILKRLCSLDNILRGKFKRGEFVDLSFAFVVGTPLEENRDMISGNILAFYRNCPSSPLEYNIGPLKGYFFAPVVVVNFPWIFENWDKWVNGKDPLKDFK